MGPEKEQSRPKRVSRVLCAGDPRGSEEAIGALLRAAEELDVQAIAVVGDLSAGAGDRPTTMTIGRTLVVAPGSLAEGSYAVADLHARSAELGELSARSR
jgi:Icc-related predicted phosphoesterase